MRTKTNVTITLNPLVAQEARVEAARRNISLSALCAESLENSLSKKRVRKRALAEVSKFFGTALNANEGPLTREEIYRDRVR